MKASLEPNSNQFILTLIPEDKADEAAIVALAHATGRPHMINCRGIQYLDANVQFRSD